MCVIWDLKRDPQLSPVFQRLCDPHEVKIHCSRGFSQTRFTSARSLWLMSSRPGLWTGRAGPRRRGNSFYPPGPQPFTLAFQTETPRTPQASAPGPRVTSPPCLLSYVLTPFSDYCPLFCAATVDTDHIIAGVSISQ